MESVLTKKQTKTFGPRPISGWGKDATITATVRYDDSCGNGSNSFAITGEIRRPNRSDCEACGMLHDEIRATFPELAPFLKWHLTASDGPMHYIANTLYWLGYQNAPAENLEHARSCAVWPDMPADSLKSSGKYTKEDIISGLRARLPELMKEFQQAVEFLGFTY